MIAVMTLSAQPAHAQGGPPLITDDPDTPGPGFWEINLGSILHKYRNASSTDLPRIDANYGVGRRIQLKLEAPWVRVAEEDTVRTGAGNVEAGVKYRFVGQEGQLIAWSVYPQLQFSATRGSIRKGTGDPATALFLPTEITIEKSHVEINVEVGRRFERGGDNAWEYGVSTEGNVLPRLELLAEVHAESRADHPREVIVNVGARPKLTSQLILLFAVGHGIRGDADERPRLLLYTGLQFNLPGLYSFKALSAR